MMNLPPINLWNLRKVEPIAKIRPAKDQNQQLKENLEIKREIGTKK